MDRGNQEQPPKLPGGFFLSHRWAADLAGADFGGLEVIGCDEQGCFSRMFENHGYSPSYEIKSAGDTWTFTGEAQRGTIQVDSPDKMTIHWELKVDANWVPLCDRVHTRSK